MKCQRKGCGNIATTHVHFPDTDRTDDRNLCDECIDYARAAIKERGYAESHPEWEEWFTPCPKL